MRTIKLIDCTLRDGGYVNNWEFGKDAIFDITRKLEQTNIEILELGFIKDESYDENRTVFNNMEQVKKLIGEKKPGIEYAVMAEVVNPLSLENLEPATPDGPDIIRVIVWKRMLKEGFEYCKGIAEKGYKLCVQPARVSQYSDEEFVEMIELFNELNPMAIYVVDSWGTMYKEELLHYLKLADEHLKPEIAVGYHGHNNMMQAFDAACAFAEYKMDRDLIIDASVYGIGRGAGNLNTELFVKYMNEKFNCSYNLTPITEIYDFYIKHIYKKYKWGYSVAYAISAKYNCNPDFADYYEKKGCPSSFIEECISSMKPEERIIFNKKTADTYSRIANFNKWNKKLAIIIITANRPEAVNGNLAGCAQELYDFGIDLIVYDSSDDESTHEIVNKYSSKFDNIKYDRWDGVYDGLSIDEKVISAYKKYSSNYEYIWTICEGLTVTINLIIEKLEHILSTNKELIVIDHFARDIKHHGSKTYTDCGLLLKEQAVYMNTLGRYIVKSDFIQKVIEEVPLTEKTYGLHFPMAFFHYYSNHDMNAALCVGEPWRWNYSVPESSFSPKNILWQWGYQWVNIINNLPSVYEEYKKEAYKVKASDFEPFSLPYLLKARYHGGLTFELINKYKEYFPSVCNIPLQKFYAIACIPTGLIQTIEELMKKIETKHKYLPFYKNSIDEKIKSINYEENKNCFELTKDVKSHLLYENNNVEDPFITVFIPTYKRTDLLSEALESVLNQQPVDFKWDIIVVDNEAYNGKQNETEKLVRSFESDRISYYRNNENIRVGDNFNRGISLARAPWVMMLHDDDLLFSNTLGKMNKAIRFLQTQKGKPLGAISTKYHQFKFDSESPFAHKKHLGRVFKRYSFSQMSYKFNKLKKFELLISGFVGGDVPSNGTTYNKKAVLDVGGFNDDLGISADHVFLYCLQNKYSVYSTCEPYGCYRWGINAMSKPESTYKVIKDYFDFREYVFSKNIFSKIYGFLFRSSLYSAFIYSVLKQRKFVSTEYIDKKYYATIYNKKPNKLIDKIWMSFINKPYWKWKKHRMRVLEKKAIEYLKTN